MLFRGVYNAGACMCGDSAPVGVIWSNMTTWGLNDYHMTNYDNPV